jgi:hypothetical protein
MSTPAPSQILYREKKMRNLGSENNQNKRDSSIGNQYFNKVLKAHSINTKQHVGENMFGRGYRQSRKRRKRRRKTNKNFKR